MGSPLGSGEGPYSRTNTALECRRGGSSHRQNEETGKGASAVSRSVTAQRSPRQRGSTQGRTPFASAAQLVAARAEAG